MVNAKISSSTPYAIFRILVGLMFLQHGLQKLFGLFGGIDGNGGTVVLVSLFGLAGIIEFLGGILITLGLFTRPVAVITGLEMLYVFIMIHTVGNGTIVPILNGGELALMFFASFLVLMFHGSGKWSVDKTLSR
tara:strand:- start:67 stop:468 length:402 start_codon:yes stop_codon:yes gene_type:complete